MKKLKFLITWLLSAYMLCFPITNCSAETNQVIYGDANCDTTVDICDVVALKQHLVGLEELSEQGKENCDFFCNTEITVQSLLNMNNYIIKTTDSLEPLTYYKVTNEEIQKYLADNNWLITNYENYSTIRIDMPIEDCSNFCFQDEDMPYDYYNFEYISLPEKIINDIYYCDVEYTINDVKNKGKSFFLKFYNTCPENLAKVYLTLEKEISQKTNSSLYHIQYETTLY